MLHAYLVCRATNPNEEFGDRSLQELHDDICCAYADTSCNNGAARLKKGEEIPWWDHEPDDGYFLKAAAHHFMGAHRLHGLSRLLLDIRWYVRKGQELSPVSLIYDFYEELLATYPELGAVRGAVIACINIVCKSPHEVETQLYGRLLAESSCQVKEFRENIVAQARRPWLRPLLSSLPGADGFFVGSTHSLSGRVTSISISDDGKKVAMGYHNGTIELFDAEKVLLIGALRGTDGCARRVAFMEDNIHLVSAHHDFMLRLWNTQTQELICTFGKHLYEVDKLCVSGDMVFSGSTFVHLMDREGDIEYPEPGPYCELKIWRDKGRELVQRIRILREGDFRFLGVIPKQFDLVYMVHTPRQSSFFTIYIRKLEKLDREIVVDGRQHGNTVLGLLPGPSLIVSYSAERESLLLWNLHTHEELFSLGTGLGKPILLRTSQTGGYVAGLFADGVLRVWETSGGYLQASFVMPLDSTRKQDFCVSGNGRRAAAVFHPLEYCSHVRLYSLTKEPDLELGLLGRNVGGVLNLSISSAGELMAVVRTNGQVELYDLTSLDRITDNEIPGAVSSIIEKELVACVNDGDSVSIIEMQSGDTVWSRRMGNELFGAPQLSSDGTRILVRVRREGLCDSRTSIWNVLDDGKEPPIVYIEDREFSRFTTFGHGNDLLCWGRSSSVVCASIATRVQHCFEGFQESPENAVIAPGGSLVVVVDIVGNIYRCSWETGEVVCIGTEPNDVMTLTLFSEGRYALLGCGDGKVSLWDVGSGVFLSSFTCEGRISACAVSMKGGLPLMAVGDALGGLHFLRPEGLA
jgi:WD40 repeat protein